MNSRDWPLRVRKSLNGPLLLPPRDHPSSQPSEPLTLVGLPTFLGNYNRQAQRKISIRLWKDSGAVRSAPAVLRVAIPGILVAYMKLAPVHADDVPLRVMSVTFMGSSESVGVFIICLLWRQLALTCVGLRARRMDPPSMPSSSRRHSTLRGC